MLSDIIASNKYLPGHAPHNHLLVFCIGVKKRTYANSEFHGKQHQKSSHQPGSYLTNARSTGNLNRHTLKLMSESFSFPQEVCYSLPKEHYSLRFAREALGHSTNAQLMVIYIDNISSFITT